MAKFKSTKLTTEQHQKIAELRKIGFTWDEISEVISNGMDGHAIRKRHGQWKNSCAYIPSKAKAEKRKPMNLWGEVRLAINALELYGRKVEAENGVYRLDGHIVPVQEIMKAAKALPPVAMAHYDHP